MNRVDRTFNPPSSEEKPAMPDSTPRALFNKWKNRKDGEQLAGFCLVHGGSVEIVRPADMRMLTPPSSSAD